MHARIRPLRPRSFPRRAQQALLAAGPSLAALAAGVGLSTAAPNEPPTAVILAPAQGAGLLTPATFTLRATGLDADGVVTRLTFALNGSAFGIATTNSAEFVVRNLFVGNYRFTVTATDDQGATGSANLDLVVKTPPTVSIAQPAAGARLNTVTNVLTGGAADSRGLDRVDYAVNGGSFQTAEGTTSWSAPIVLAPGTNFVRVRAIDRYGNASSTNGRTFFLVVPSPISLTTSGEGTLRGLTDGQTLEVNRGYRVSAVPATGQVFSNWTGSVTSSSADLQFLMQPNFSLTAHFVPNPFPSASGTYDGLFLENPTQFESTGDFTFRLTPSGAYSASLRLAGQKLRAAGRLNLEGDATNLVARPGHSPLQVSWSTDLHGLNSVTGIVSDGVWRAELRGHRATFRAGPNPAPLAGRYTVAIEPEPASDAPPGAGPAVLQISSDSIASYTGSLPDGTRLTGRATVSADGDWPVYAPLYQNQGLIAGWVHVDTNATLQDLSGSLAWFRPAQAGAPLYPAGFTNRSHVVGSRFLPPTTPADPLLNLVDATATFFGDDLSQTWTNPIQFSPNRVTNLGSNRLSLSVVRNTGQFRGSLIDPNLNRSFPFNGVLLQKSTNGAGYFLGPTAGGRVTITAP